ncbi:MAG: hypothetical protein P8X55_19235, partial [Desulfosarcinaceae bacterium]
MLNLFASNRDAAKAEERKAVSGGSAAFARPARLPAFRLSLSFSGRYAGLEDEYRESYFNRYLTHIRHCHWLAIFLYDIFGILDIYLFPDQAASFLIIRLGIVTPLFLAGLALSYTRWYRRIWTWMLMFYVLITATGYMVMGSMVPMIHSFGYFVGVVASLIFGYTYIRLPVPHATAGGWLVFLLYWFFQAKAVGPPESVLFNQIGYLGGLSLLLMIICYTRDRDDRHSFLLSHLLAAEKDKVSRINEDLEETVHIRTLDLEMANMQLSREIEAHKASE